MQKIKIQIIEDESLIAFDLEDLLKGEGYETCTISGRANEAVEIFQAEKPDIVLIDINLRGKESNTDGIEAAIKIQSLKRTPIIFLTRITDKKTLEMAKRAFPSAYLNKPYKETDLTFAIELAIYNFINNTTLNQTGPNIPEYDNYILNDALFIKQKTKLIKIMLLNIYFIKASGNYVDIYLSPDKKVTQIAKLSDIAERLPCPPFLQVHRSYIVNIPKVDSVDTQLHELAFQNVNIPVSQTNWDNFLSLFSRS